MKNIFSAVLLLVALIGCNQVKQETLFDNISIEVRDTSRTFLYTNKKSGFYFGNTNSYNNDSLQGWTLNGKRILNDYIILVNNKPLDRTKSVVTIYPHLLQRNYDELREELFLADSIDLIMISLKNPEAEKIELGFAGLNTNNISVFKNNVASISLNNLLPGNSLYITADCKIINSKDENNLLTFDTNDKDSVTILIDLSSSPNEIKQILKNPGRVISKKKDRLEKLLNESYILTNDEEVNQSLLWAKISLDGLITTTKIKGINSGIPSDFTFSSRNNLISLPGAALVQGNYDEAKNILLEILKLQDKNPESKFYGRMIDKFISQESAYYFVDVTPWFIIQCCNYFYYSGDMDFIGKIYPDIKLAFESTLRNFTDNNGFLITKNPGSLGDRSLQHNVINENGSRTAEDQALWYRQLINSYEIGNLLGDTTYAKKFLMAASRIRTNFQKYFIDTTKNIIYNKINPDGSRNVSIRPNQFIVLNEPGLFKNSIQRLKSLGNITQSLVLPIGVLSLSQDNEKFYPFYDNTGNIHNGLIRQWNTGPVIQALCGFGQQNTAWQLTEELNYEIIYMGTVGTLAELMDAYPKNDNKDPDLHGNVSYSLSLAEYIRNFYQDYLGVKPDAFNKALYLLPTLPDDLIDVEFDQDIGKDKVKIHYRFTNEMDKIEIKTISLQDSIDIGVAILNKADANFQMKTSYHKNDNLVFEVPAHSNSIHDLKVFRNGKRIPISCQIYNEPPANYSLYQNIKFAKPLMSPEFTESKDTLTKKTSK